MRKGNANNNTITRRTFLGASVAAAGTAAFGFPAIVRGQNLNEKLNIAMIGVGGRGSGNLGGVQSENITVMCDVNEKNLTNIAKHFPKARTEKDFRKVYDRAGEFDAALLTRKKAHWSAGREEIAAYGYLNFSKQAVISNILSVYSKLQDQ